MLSSLVQCVLFSSLAAHQIETASGLGEKNQETMSSIRTLLVTGEARITEDAGSTWMPMQKFQWAKDGAVERIWAQTFYTEKSKGKTGKASYTDHLYLLDSLKSLDGWNPTSQPQLPLGPSDGYAGIRGSIQNPPPSTAVEGIPHWMLFWPDGQEVLSEMIKKSKKSGIIGKSSIQGRDVWEIEVTKEDLTFRFSLDAGRGFVITKKTILSKMATTHYDVLEFKEVKPGLYLPVYVKCIQPTNPSTMTDFKAQSISVNDPLPSDAFNFSFPQGLKVVDQIKKKIYIWGSDGPERTFNSAEEAVAWENGEGRNPVASANRWPILLAASTICAVVLLLVTAGKRYLARSSQPK